ncbi:MAG: hypothetical protein RLZZ497_791, partial [Pseudomonadota bacterium]
TERLNDILYKPLTVENIETFADKALDDTVDLVRDLLNEPIPMEKRPKAFLKMEKRNPNK